MYYSAFGYRPKTVRTCWCRLTVECSYRYSCAPRNSIRESFDVANYQKKKKNL